MKGLKKENQTRSTHRIVHVSTVHRALDARIFLREARSLAEAGYEVFVLAWHESAETRDGVKIIPLRIPKNRLLRMCVGGIRVLCWVRRLRVDLCHLHDPELVVVGRLLRFFGHQVVLDLHEDVPEQVLSKQWIPRPLRHPVATSLRRLEKRLSRWFDGLVTATPHIAEQFTRGRIACVRNFPPAALALRPRTVAAKTRVTYVGTIAVNRGAYELLDAFKRVSKQHEAQLDLIGPIGDGALRRAVQEEVAKADGTITWTDWIPPEDVWMRILSANIGVVALHPLPRYRVALPVKLFEYMAAGVAVIASDFPLWREIVESSACGICVNPLDVDELVQALETLLTDPVQTGNMGENGRKAILGKYNWDREKDALLGLYEKLLEFE